MVLEIHNQLGIWFASVESTSIAQFVIWSHKYQRSRGIRHRQTVTVISVKVCRCHIQRYTTQESNTSNNSMVISSRSNQQVSSAYKYPNRPGLIRANRAIHFTAFIRQPGASGSYKPLSAFGVPKSDQFVWKCRHDRTGRRVRTKLSCICGNRKMLHG